MTRKCKALTNAIDVVRQVIALTLFEGWSHHDFDERARLMQCELADQQDIGGQASIRPMAMMH